MTRDALAARNELFLATATIAAHSNSQGKTFRQRDVRFFVELFSNWTSFSPRDSLWIQNTQLSRYLRSLIVSGCARVSDGKRTPQYRLSRLGLIELLTRISNPSSLEKKEQIFFLIYFVRNYRERLLDLVKSEGAQYPVSLRLELEALLNADSILNNAIARTEQELRQIDARIEAAEATSLLVKKRLAAGINFGEIVGEVEDRYPYELNSEKPLKNLISEVPPEQQRWELETGTACRADQVWKVFRRLLQVQLEQLQALRD